MNTSKNWERSFSVTHPINSNEKVLKDKPKIVNFSVKMFIAICFSVHSVSKFRIREHSDVLNDSGPIKMIVHTKFQ